MSTDNQELTEEEKIALKKIADAKIEKDKQTLHWPSSPAWPSNFKSPGDDLKQAQSTSGGSASIVYGNFYKYMHADSYTSTTGDSWSQNVGNSYSMTMGASESFKLSNDFSATLGGSESVTLGALKMGFTGTALETSISLTGLKVDFTKSGKVINLNGDDVSTTVKGKWDLDVTYMASIDAANISLKSAFSFNVKTLGAKGISLDSGSTFSVKSTAKTSIEAASVDLKGGNIVLEAPVGGITLKCGDNSITISPTGITIKAGETAIELNSLVANIEANGSKLNLGAAGIIQQGKLIQVG
ncbi:hypothetical protein OAO18_05865 [Francisellaceae bacterium]|nr:hypothetical protein [Francisellaceae bacterium]